MDENDWLAARSEEQRAHLRSIAYRMLGSLAEADDAVQNSWLRLSSADATGVENLGQLASRPARTTHRRNRLHRQRRQDRRDPRDLRPRTPPPRRPGSARRLTADNPDPVVISTGQSRPCLEAPPGYRGCPGVA